MDHIVYRPFRNSDLPEIVRVWNDVEVFTKSRRKMDWTRFSQQVLAKPYFSPEFFLVAVDTSDRKPYPHDGRIIGFIHGGFSPKKTMDGEDRSRGCVAMIAVESDEGRSVSPRLTAILGENRLPVAAQLLKHLEEAFLRVGTRELTAGAVYPDAPFYFGIFIGGESPGLYEKNVFLNSLLRKNGYEMHRRYSIHKVNLDAYYSPMTRQKKAIREEYDFRPAQRQVPTSWWEAAAMSTLEMKWYELHEKEVSSFQFPVSRRCEPPSGNRKLETGNSSTRCAWALVENRTLFTPDETGRLCEEKRLRFHHLEVDAAYRQRGLGSFLVNAVLESAKKDRVTYVEILVPEENSSANEMFRRLNPESTATGLVYRKELTIDN